jgi:hypothetical protein
MTWLAENWIWVLFGVAFVAMHLFGHGGHGGHGSHGNDHRSPSDAPTRRTGESRPVPPADTTGSHRH